MNTNSSAIVRMVKDPKTWVTGFIAVAISLALELVDLNEIPARWFVAAMVGVTVSTVAGWLEL